MKKSKFRFFLLGAIMLFARVCATPAQGAAGDLYLANNSAKNIPKFAPAGTRTDFASSVEGPSGLAFDGKGNLFVASLVGGSSAIFKFTAGGTRSVFTTDVGSPEGIAIDALGNLYVADLFNASILKFTPAGTKSIFASGFSGPTGLAFDKSGNLFVTNNFDGSVIRITPSGIKSTFAFGLQNPFGAAFDGSGNLFVAEAGSGSISKFTPAGAKSTFASGITAVSGLAFDPSGNLFAASRTANSVFLFTPTGGKSTFVSGLSDPFFIAFEPTPHNLLNISTRGLVGTGDGALIGGFIVGGNGLLDGTVIVRAIGPSLAAFGVSGVLQDPTTEVRDASGTVLGQNDDWKIGTQQARIQATGVAPTNDRESALIVTLPAGNYTAIVRGFNNTTGIGLVEVYNLQ